MSFEIEPREADRPVADAGDLDVRRERVEAVGPVRADGDRIGRIRIERRRVEAVGLRQQHRPRLARRHQSGVGVAAQRNRRAAVAAVEIGEPGQPLAVVGLRIAGAERRLVRIAEDRAQEPGLHVGPPGDARRRREVVQVRLVALRALLEQDVLRTRAARARRAEGSCTCCRGRRRPDPSGRRCSSIVTADMTLLAARTASGRRSGCRRSA